MNSIFHTEIAEGLFRLSETKDGFSDAPGKATRNSYLIIGAEKSILFDLALECDGLYEYACNLAKGNVEVVLSHGHYDHTFYANALNEVWLHPADFVLLEKGMLIFLPVEPCPNLNPLYDGDIIDLGNRKIKVIHFPGHTDGGILLLDEFTATLLTGDVVSRRLLFNFPGSINLTDFCDNLNKLKLEDFNVIYTAHDRCGLPKAHIDLMLNTIKNKLPEATATWESPFGDIMIQCTVGNEENINYFDICVDRKLI